MAGLRENGSVPSLPPPLPKSPPQYPDLYGKRKEFAKVQVLEREIGFLEEELKSIDVLHPASKSCREVLDFVTANADPLIPTTTKARKSCRFWKWLCRVSCFNFSWICCCSCTPHLELPRCCYNSNCDCSCNCNPCDSCSNPCPSCSCRMPKCHCASCWNCNCFGKLKCSRLIRWLNCCSGSRGRSSLCGGDCMPPKCPSSSCPTCSSKRCCCTCYYPKCPKFNLFSCCHNICCYPCYFCY